MNGMRSSMWRRFLMLFDRSVKRRLASELPPASAKTLEMLFPRRFDAPDKSNAAASDKSADRASEGGHKKQPGQ